MIALSDAARPARPRGRLKVSTLLASSAMRKLDSLAIVAASSSATVAALATFASAAASPSFSGIARQKLYVRRAFEGSTAAMALFVAISGWFLAGHFLSARRREVALRLLAGMRRKQVLAELALELGAAALCGLACGLGAAAFLSRLLALALGALMEQGQIPELRFGTATLVAGAVASTVQLLLAAARAAVETRRSSILDLVRSERRPERAPERKTGLAILGASSIAAGYAAAFFSRGLLAEILILPAFAAAALGTFLAFDALVPALALGLRRRSLRASAAPLSAASLFAAAQIAYRSRRNARLLALCSVLVGMASSAAGTVATMALRSWKESNLGQEELFGALLFIGSFLALAFALSAAALLASRASADARDDAARRDSFRQLGAARGDIRLSIALQNAFFFGLPAVFGIAHSAAAMAMLRTFSGYSTIGPAAATAAATGTLIALAAAASTARQMESLLGERDGSPKPMQQAKESR